MENQRAKSMLPHQDGVAKANNIKGLHCQTTLSAPIDAKGPSTALANRSGHGKKGAADIRRIGGSEKPVSIQQNHTTGRAVGPEQLVIVVSPVPGAPGCFEARLDGDCIVASSRTPFCDAAKRLIDLGYDRTAILRMMHAGNTTVCLRASLGVAAAQTVEESAHGPMFRRCRIGSASAVEAARMRSKGLPQAAPQHPLQPLASARAGGPKDLADGECGRLLIKCWDGCDWLADALLEDEGAHHVGRRPHRYGNGTAPNRTQRRAKSRNSPKIRSRGVHELGLNAQNPRVVHAGFGNSSTR
jgi:hypothetical protein